ncbi:MAG: hypothetical protein GTN38_03745 [Candidatus Aenigmarchaeota archaeon]|nr:hypothetical protein [Candidatus Aenigmarchaeota archaeon]NIP40776.1 hypothetical protein [Candidatus Aenigmarchaeota archaeon]NIQ17366.1 hypothetical protein [Candidatus Aenigmarchaeota archaeon]NIS73479.1 hypothetical protein [Candidatus Aenigmarchaeota archaeon]
MIERYIENVNGGLTPEELLDLIIEKLDPNRIVEDRLYSFYDVPIILKKSFNVSLLKKLVEKDGRIEIYIQGKASCIMGEDIPRAYELMRIAKFESKRFKHDYPIAEDEVEYVSVIDIANEKNIHLNYINERLKENSYARELVYRTLISEKRVVRKEDKEKFIELVT